jgi:hypothetical protein
MLRVASLNAAMRAGVGFSRAACSEREKAAMEAARAGLIALTIVIAFVGFLVFRIDFAVTEDRRVRIFLADDRLSLWGAWPWGNS